MKKILLACFIGVVSTTVIIPVEYSFGWMHLIAVMLFTVVMFKALSQIQAESEAQARIEAKTLDEKNKLLSREMKILETEADQFLHELINSGISIALHGDRNNAYTRFERAKKLYEKIQRRIAGISVFERR